MKPSSTLSRRSFLLRSAAVGGGLLLEVSVPTRLFAKEAKAASTASRGPEVTAWVLISPDDKVTIRVARVEMGQGSYTGLPMLIAEELACDWNKVQPEYASTSENLRRNRVFGDMLRWQSVDS